MAEIVENIVSALGSLAIQEITSAWGVKKKLKELEDAFSTINDLLPHAEEMEVNNPMMKHWLKRIKDIAYEAEDVIDEFSIEAARRERLVNQNPIKKVSQFASSSNPIIFPFNMASKIKHIKNKLSSVLSHKPPQLEVKGVTRFERTPTHSFVNESGIFGRDVEKQKIVDLLLSSDGFDHLTILPIQGLGGMGKTTLAKMAFNDKRVVTHFKPKVWISVSEKFDVDKVIENIFESATQRECPKLKMDLVQSLLREEIKENRFLLVLDDVLNEDPEKWDSLKELLMVGASGSKILVTTRNQKVASIMGTVSTMQLVGLSDDDCWNVFKQKAFEAGQEETHPSLVEIGKEIVKKCGGIPLAAKALGGLMRSKKNEREWLQIRNSDVWELPQEEHGILPSLRLTYNHMPFFLRQCFAYCSLFPKGHKFYKGELVQSWIAHGFVISSGGGNITLEEIGSQYVEELMWRSFFQDAELYGNELVQFKMHDLVHDLAQIVAGTEYFTVVKGSTKQIPNGVRHLCIDDKLFPMDTLQTPNLRTLVLRHELSHSIGNFISTLKSLRVLLLDNYCDDRLPNSICKLKHLRHLKIKSSSLTKLPKSITKLQSLWYLQLWCEKLKELPKDLGTMITLRGILLDANSPLTYMPAGIGKLVSLQRLTLFVVGEDSGSKLSELSGLNLSNVVVIKNLENVSSSRETAEVNLIGKPKLLKLELVWNEVQESRRNEKIAFDVLETLEPHRNLITLSIKGYEGARFANWMMSEERFLPNLRHVSLSKCKECQNLPPLGQLQFLERLQLLEMDALEFIESSKHERNRKEWFPSLKKLWLQELPNLKSWVTKGGHPETSFLLSLTCLEELTVVNCPKLMTMPLVPSLEYVRLDGVSQLLVQATLCPQPPFPPGDNPVSLSKLNRLLIQHCDDLVSLPLRDLTSLKGLRIEKCPRLSSFMEEELQGMSSLLDLRISECESFTTLSTGMRHLTSLECLYLHKLPKLVSLPEEVQKSTKLKELRIIDCEGLTSLPDGLRSLTSLRDLEILSEGLLSLPDGLGNLKSVTRLFISVSSSLDHLPEQLQDLTSLQLLQIRNCKGLVSLPGWIVNFSSLQRLEIIGCPRLEHLPEQMTKLTRLRILLINDCDKLTSRCKKGKGEEWPKIAHVPEITLQ